MIRTIPMMWSVGSCAAGDGFKITTKTGAGATVINAQDIDMSAHTLASMPVIAADLQVQIRAATGASGTETVTWNDYKYRFEIADTDLGSITFAAPVAGTDLTTAFGYTAGLNTATANVMAGEPNPSIRTVADGITIQPDETEISDIVDCREFGGVYALCFTLTSGASRDTHACSGVAVQCGVPETALEGFQSTLFYLHAAIAVAADPSVEATRYSWDYMIHYLAVNTTMPTDRAPMQGLQYQFKNDTDSSPDTLTVSIHLIVEMDWQ